MGGGRFGDFGRTRGSFTKDDIEKLLDGISNTLTAASLIPGIDTFADMAAIPVDLLRGDFMSAGLDAIGMIPIVGEVADTAKLAKVADKTTDIVNAANKAKKFGKGIEVISPSQLAKTHKLTLSKKRYKDLVDSISKKGITEPIKYVEHNGSKYVVDGHHRLRAAKELKITDVPAEKVSLPYKGYKSIKDLLWDD